MGEGTPEQIALEVGKIFTPAVPVSESDLFAGRLSEIRRIVDAVNQRGQHAAIFGYRGVGKTSLANIISSKLTANVPVVAPHVNCDSLDTFTSLWKKVLSDIDLQQKRKLPGFQLEMFVETKNAADVLGDSVSPDDIRRLFTFLGEDKVLIVIFDEFDRMDSVARRAVADTIKTLSDHAVPVTVIIVGVAETVDDLISEHESIERALVQVEMPRMSRPELTEILTRGTKRLSMSITDEAAGFIATLSHGLPHYTHLLGLHAARTALDLGKKKISADHVNAAISQAVANSDASLRSDFRKAITSPQQGNIFREVLLAAAMAPTDEFGYFPAAAVRAPLSMIRGRHCDIPSFARHLKSFCQKSRGGVLEKSGTHFKLRYRFVNALMPPLIVMKGLADQQITAADVFEVKSGEGERPVN